MTLTTADLLRWRLQAQHLLGPPLAGPARVVEHLLAVQAQDFLLAVWSLGRRSGTDAAAVTAAFDAGEVRRTHVLRPTWHVVTPVDLGWLLALTAPRVHQVNGSEYRRYGLDPARRARCADVVVGGLQSGPRTRGDLQADLAAAGIELSGQALAYALMHVELEGLMASGPMHGKHQTYAVFDVDLSAIDRDMALAELAVRFVTGRGPSTEDDLAGWATLTLTDARRAVDLAGDRLDRVESAGRTFLVGAGSEPPPAGPKPVVHLLQSYDEHVQYGSGLFDSDGVARRAWDEGGWPHNSLLSVDGAFAGWWRRTVRREQVLVEVVLVDQLTSRQRAALTAEADRFGDHLGLTARVELRLR